MQKFLFIGLGNPGSEFSKSRHNFGITTLRAWVQAAENTATVTPFKLDEKINGEVAKVTVPDVLVLCLFPHTFMNDSGKAVAKFLSLNPIDQNNIVILHDDLELALGEIKLIAGGSAKGHNGVRSIQDEIDTLEIPRLRLGIGRPPEELDAKDFVLANFSQDEQLLVGDTIAKAIKYLSLITASGVTAAMLEHRSLE